ncbi:MAG: hypothetical protein AAF583_09805 [Pseudomonadota bacterium]
MDGEQLGFDTLLQDAAADNAARAFDRETDHLPGTWVEALALHRQQIDEHHAAMLASDIDAAMAIRQEAHLLAQKLNGGNTGVLANDDAPGCKLDKDCTAPHGHVPQWGQRGVFILDSAGVTAQVTMGGMFGIGATAMPYLGFSVRAVDDTKPFLSNTGYRSFLGCSVPPELGMTPDGFVARVLEAYVSDVLCGKLMAVNRDWHRK